MTDIIARTLAFYRREKMLYAIHLNDNSLFCVFTSLDLLCSPNSLYQFLATPKLLAVSAVVVFLSVSFLVLRVLLT